MQNQFRLFKRGNVYYRENVMNGEQRSLKTRDENEARKLIQASNDAANGATLNLKMAAMYLEVSDPKLLTRTWADVQERFCNCKHPATKMRHERVVKTKPMQFLRNKKLLETRADDLLAAMAMGPKSTISFLQTMHNDALGMGWILNVILAPKKWPVMQRKPRHAISLEQHKLLLNAVQGTEWSLYLELLYSTGCAQTDGANLSSKNVDWTKRVLSYARRKLGDRDLPPAQLGIGQTLERILKQLPDEGPFFPNISKMDDRSRACFFWKLCKKLKLPQGVSLHSYRYAWAIRAKEAGIPERWSRAALGHNSSAVHEAYARMAYVVCPPVD